MQLFQNAKRAGSCTSNRPFESTIRDDSSHLAREAPCIYKETRSLSSSPLKIYQDMDRSRPMLCLPLSKRLPPSIFPIPKNHVIVKIFIKRVDGRTPSSHHRCCCCRQKRFVIGPASAIKHKRVWLVQSCLLFGDIRNKERLRSGRRMVCRRL